MKLEAMAVFIIVLLLGIPLYSTSVYADMITSVDVRGSSGAPSYRKLADSTTFTAQVTGQDITPDRVYLETMDGTYQEQFDACEVATFGYTCVKSLSESTISDGTYQYPVRLYDFPGGVIMSTVFGTITTDDVAPEVNTFVLNKYVFMSSETIEISYSVSDNAFIGCSGIDKVELFRGSSLYDSYYVNSTSCNYDGSVSLNISGNGSSNSLYLKVYDKVGFVSDTAELSFEVDDNGPTIDVLNITKDDGSELDYIPAAGINARIFVSIDDEDFKSVSGKFIDINPAYNTYNEFIPGNCEFDEEWICSWEVYIDIDDTVVASLDFKVEDDVGNIREQTINYNLEMDNGVPVITGIETNYGIYAGLVSNFTAIISESGSGFDDLGIYMSLVEVSSAGVVRAQDCNSTPGGWRCDWNEISGNQPDGVKTVSIIPSSSDDMGNLVSGILDYNITLDTSEPIINSLEIIPIYGSVGMPVNLSQPKTGDSILVVVNISDLTPVTASADFSEVLLEPVVMTVDCGEEICEWETTEVIPGPAEGTIYFTFNDSAGNTLEVEEDIIIYGVDNSSQLTELWLIDNDWNEDRMPFKVDAQTTSLIQYSIYHPFELNEKYGYNSQIIDVFDLSCSNGTEFLGEDPVLFGLVKDEPEQSGSWNPSFLTRTLLGLRSFNDNLEVDCNFKIISLYDKLGGTYVSYPEQHNVTLEVEFEGIALGTLSDGIQESIDSVKNSAIMKMDWVSDIEKVIGFFSGICRSINMAVTIAAGLNTVTTFIGIPVIGDAVYGFFAGTIAGSKAVDMGCAVITCRGWGGAVGIDWLDSWEGKLETYMSGFGLLDFLPEEMQSSFEGMMDPKKSIVMSTAMLCLPGITYNIHKAREIGCGYIYCMEKEVVEGKPPVICSKELQVLSCEFLWGQGFYLLPLAHVIDYFIESVANALTNPIILAFSAASVGCLIDGTSPATNFCLVAASIDAVGQAVSTVASLFSGDYWSNFGTSDFTYCDKVEEEGLLD